MEKKWRQSNDDTAYLEYTKQANKASKVVKSACGAIDWWQWDTGQYL